MQVISAAVYLTDFRYKPQESEALHVQNGSNGPLTTSPHDPTNRLNTKIRIINT